MSGEYEMSIALISRPKKAPSKPPTLSMMRQLIVCSRGLGKLLPNTCARRWRIANHKEAGNVGQGNECAQCPDGARRSGSDNVAAHVAKPTGSEFGEGAMLRCLCCGSDYHQRTRQQRYCRSKVCQNRRAALHVKRAFQKRTGKPITPFPWESVLEECR